MLRFRCVAPNSSMARPGQTGTTGASESNLPCQNNVLKFANSSTWTTAPASTTAAPSSTTASNAALTTISGSCVEAEQSCASPEWGPVCCTSGYTCTFYQDTGYARCLRDSSTAPGQSTTSAAATATTQETASTTSPTTGCIEAEQSCASPGWGPVCCTSGYTCTFYKDTGYARCLRQGALMQNLDQKDRMHHRKKTASGFLAPEHALLQTQTMLSLTASMPKEL